jgi:type VI secretion system secreted protein Hcp
MAETVHLFLKANGTDIEGESSQTSLGREGSIECLSYEQGVATAREAGSGLATGRRQYQPLVVRKRLDRASPLLLKALTENQVIEGTFRFYRPDPSGDGTTQHFYTVVITQARITGVRQLLPDVLGPDTADDPPQEELSFAVGSIEWTYEPDGITHQDVVGIKR